MEQVKKLVIKVFEEIDGCCEYCRCALEDPGLSDLCRDVASSKLENASRLMSAVTDKASAQEENSPLRCVVDILSEVASERMQAAKTMMSSIK